MDKELFRSIAEQMMSGDTVESGGKRYSVRRTSSHRLKSVTFTVGGSEFTAIEQNREKPSRWGQLARDGHKVVQFKDVASNRFVAVAVDGEVREYGKK